MTTPPTGQACERELTLEIQGLGIVMYSPSSARHIQAGEDYLSQKYLNGEQVQPHIQAGSLVSFGTGSPGTYRLRFRDGYPGESLLSRSQARLRLGLHVVDGLVYFRDLYDLMDWNPVCPDGQTLELANGYYHVTLCTSRPASGVIGDDQLVLVYLQPLPEMPALAKTGIPSLIPRPT